MVAAIELNLCGDEDLFRIDTVIRALLPVNFVEDADFRKNGCQLPVEIIRDVDVR